MQLLILFITLVGIACIAAAFLYAIRNTGEREDDYLALSQRAYRIRRWWLIGLCSFGLILAVATLMPFPLSVNASDSARVIKVVGGQWYWKLDSSTASVGETVHFDVTSADVNHGFALYDPDDRIVAQTQAMPGYTNTLSVTFERPGTYRVMCLEYCGLAHHGMIVEFTVTGVAS